MLIRFDWQIGRRFYKFPAEASERTLTRLISILHTQKSNRKLTIAHDDTAINLDGAAGGDDINMNLRIPVSPGKLGVGVTEGDVQAGHLLILQQVAGQLFEAGEGADGKFARPIAVGGRKQVVMQFAGQFLVLAADTGDIAAFDSNGNRMLQDTILLREVVAEHIADEHAVDAGGSREDFAFWQVAPFALLVVASVAGNPLPILVKSGRDIAALLRGDVDGRGIAHEVVDLIGQAEDFIVVGAHAVRHEGFIDADHVAVTDFEFLSQERQQGNTHADFARLGRGNVEGHGRARRDNIVAHLIGKEGKGTLAIVFQKAHSDISMAGERGACYIASNVLTSIISDDKDAILRCDAHAAHSILGSQSPTLLKREALNVAPGRERMTCLTRHRCTPLNSYVYFLLRR